MFSKIILAPGNRKLKRNPTDTSNSLRLAIYLRKRRRSRSSYIQFKFLSI